jgi:hypothetical protein
MRHDVFACDVARDAYMSAVGITVPVPFRHRRRFPQLQQQPLAIVICGRKPMLWIAAIR